jgi:predicted dehydrogenase
MNKGGYTRKEFLKRLALGTGAALTLPAAGSFNLFQDTKYYETWRRKSELPDSDKLGIALVGLGNYSTGQLGPALLNTKLCRLSGIVTGTPEKEDRWAEEYGIPRENIYNYENYDSIADNPDIDIIYVVLPNSMHAEYTIRAAQAGKHILCEKPMATSVADCSRMITACRENDRKLGIGYRLHFEPHNEEMMRLGTEEIFGPVNSIEGGFGFNITGNPDVWRLDKELAGGGPMMDVGIYVIQGALYTLGELPVSVEAHEEKTMPEIFNEVEETIHWEMDFPSGARFNAVTSYLHGSNFLRAEAANGNFGIQPAYSYNGIRGETSRGPMDFPQVNQQTLHMDAFADHILNGTENRVPGEMGMRDVDIMMSIYEAVERGEKMTLDLSHYSQ